MKIGLIQQSNTADQAANLLKLEQNIRKAAAQGAELIVLQELHNGLYFCQTEDTAIFAQAEPIPGPSTTRFGALAQELGVVIV
ncbi:MAG: nitrilase-related carbon-nitrogen hydrolase, partial [Parabacteroides sp.]|nr:nitrilase-related carbon-nitrogen hydrolase [Parabacteroides sp.]